MGAGGDLQEGDRGEGQRQTRNRDLGQRCADAEFHVNRGVRLAALLKPIGRFQLEPPRYSLRTHDSASDD